MSEEEVKKERKPNSGQFKKGNTIGKETRFTEGNDDSNKYKEEYCEAILEYFSQPPTRVEYKETYHKGELTSRTPIILPNEYPTFELFAAKIGVTVCTLLNWCEKHPRFKVAHAQAKEIQLGKLTAYAVTGLYNPVYAKFEAVNNHNKRDKQEVDTNVSGKLEAPMDEKTRALIERVEKRMSEQDNGGGESKQ